MCNSTLLFWRGKLFLTQNLFHSSHEGETAEKRWEKHFLRTYHIEKIQRLRSNQIAITKFNILYIIFRTVALVFINVENFTRESAFTWVWTSWFFVNWSNWRRSTETARKLAAQKGIIGSWRFIWYFIYYLLKVHHQLPQRPSRVACYSKAKVSCWRTARNRTTHCGGTTVRNSSRF